MRLRLVVACALALAVAVPLANGGGRSGVRGLHVVFVPWKTLQRMLK